MLALAKLGPPAIPTLAVQLSSTAAAGDLWVMECIRTLGTNALPLIPAIVQNVPAPQRPPIRQAQLPGRAAKLSP
jgi:hypothetical protein